VTSTGETVPLVRTCSRFWTTALFCAATLPTHLIGFPLICTGVNQLAKRVGLQRIESALARVSEPLEIEVTEAEVEV